MCFVSASEIQTEKKDMRKFFSAIGLAAVCSIIVLPALAQKTINKTNTSQPVSDHAFFKKAIEANAAEIELGKLAQSKSQDPRVKEFASTQVKDHSDALSRLRQAEGGTQSPETAEGKAGVTLSKEHQRLIDHLAGLSGNEFDREYINAMVKEHQKDIRDFEAQANALPPAGTSGREKPTPEAQSQTVARDLLPVLQTHLQEAQSLQQAMGGR
jgi:putative membrane protein